MQLNDEPLSYYDILELTADATPQEIRSAYLRLKASYGKDNVANYSVYTREETDQMLQKIEESYLILSNPERRKAYDLSHQGHSSVTSTSDHSHSSFRAETPSETPVPTTTATVMPAYTDSFFTSNDDAFAGEQDWSGATLKRVRESRRISIEDLADYTRISKNYLLALEEENYQKLPAVVYVRGFLQQVSKRLKLPTDQVVQKYIERLKAARPDKF